MTESVPLYRSSSDSGFEARDSNFVQEAYKVSQKPSSLSRAIQRLHFLIQRHRPYRGGSYTRLDDDRTFSSTHYRRRCSRWVRVVLLIIYACIAFITISLLHGLLRPSYITPPLHYADLERTIVESNKDGRGNTYNEKIFIAANILNEDLIRGVWGERLLELVGILGQDNVFISIYENDAGKGTRDALFELQRKLPCDSSIVAGDHIFLNEFPTVITPSGEKRVKRLTYLAEVRNRAMLPLQNGPHVDAWAKAHPSFRRAEGRFDRVLFLNDVYFNPVEATQLLFATNRGSDGIAHYTAACAVDFVAQVMFYDQFVVHDMEGYGTGLMFYPWFPPSGESQSRNDVLALKDSVRVRSCWGGMAAFDASVFQERVIKDNVTVPALQFRSTNEPYWEEAECCLIFADIETKMASLHEQGQGVFLNPYVRVAYDQMTWDWLPTWRRYERIFQFLQYIVSKIGYPEYNPRREHAAGARVEERVWIPEGEEGAGSWRNIERNADAGGWCGQRRMFVMKSNLQKANADGGGKNWEKVKVPKGL